MTQMAMPEPQVSDANLSRQVSSTAVSVAQKFYEYHRRHPEVYEEIVRLCREWRAAGPRPWSILAIFPVIRYQRHIRGLPDPEETFKISNNYMPYYARLVMEQEPDLQGIFTLHEMKGDG